MTVFSKITRLSLPYNCYEVGHTWTPNCSEAALTLGASIFKEAIKIYTPLYTLSQIFSRKFSLQSLSKLLQSVLTSSCFLTCNGFCFILIFCLFRRISGKFYYHQCAFAPAFMAALLSILIERENRRGPLALYVTNVASETLFRMAVFRGIARPVPHGEVIMFSLASAFFLFITKKEGFSKDILSVFIKHILGPDEVVQKETTSNCTKRESISKTASSGNVGQKDLNHMLQHKGHLNRFYNYRTLLYRVPRHQSCPHSASCILYMLEGFLRPFAIGLFGHAALRLVTAPQKFLKKPQQIIRLLTRGNGMNLGLFMGSFGALFKMFLCILRWTRNKDKDWHAIPAGLLAGSSMLFFPSPALSLYVVWKLVEVSYAIGIEHGVLPSIKGSILVLYAVSTAILFYAAVLEPHNLKPAYLHFLNRVTGQRFNVINRHVLDVFGTQAALLFPEFPLVDRKHCSRVFLESVLVWLPG